MGPKIWNQNGSKNRNQNAPRGARFPKYFWAPRGRNLEPKWFPKLELEWFQRCPPWASFPGPRWGLSA